MSKVDKETVKNLTKLSRIDCTDEEQDAILLDLQKILEYFEQLQEITTENVAACNQVLENVENVMREDVIGQTLSRETFLSNAPSQVGGMIKVPPVIKQM